MHALLQHLRLPCQLAPAIASVQHLLEQHHGCQLHTSQCCQQSEPNNSTDTSAAQESADEALPEGSTRTEDAPDAAAAAAAGTDSHGRARHVGLDNPVLNIYLRYNTQFMTDLDREYKIGQLAAFERKTRLELRKGLAAHRLQLRDEAAAADASGRQQQRGMLQQMHRRLADMQDYMLGTARS